ncbi:beta-glucosidase [Paraliobacillus zengyii]|uniref:beta-glucosidase n=1 Tax=Paraliobacillus zengyii TaxID=2213194 RepID=UPI000DD2EE3C|nr:glycoside hydrolase family 3 N-terminal domain-containing protein [Paraliobacillus zengyii]
MNSKNQQPTIKKKRKIIRKVLLSVFIIIVIAANLLLQVFEAHANLYLGRGDVIINEAEGTNGWESQYYPLDYENEEEVISASEEMIEEISNEGFVLMKNNGVLPMAEQSKVTLLGRNSADPVYGGSGSGSVSLDTVVDMKTGLLNTGFEINEEVYSVLEEYAGFETELTSTGSEKRVYNNPKADIIMDRPEDSSYYIGEMPVDNYTQEAIDSFTNYSDAAIVSIGRGGGEGGDLTTDMAGWDKNYEEGQHQLELNYDERETIELAKENFENVIVVVNSSAALEMGDLEEDEGVDAIVWVGSPGQTGFNALGNILNGSVNPSGKTADIYPADFTKDPTFVNFGSYQYSNISDRNASGDAFFVQYEEGVYIGYRYYETAAEEGFIDYDEAVVYPFGHGLSYTTFDWEVVDQQLGDVDGEITVDVEVTNTGDTYSGKEVVQLYYSAPYYEGGIEKSEVVLGDFAKTSLLAPGESEIVSVIIAVEDMASYDYEDNKSYVLDEGEYEILIQNNSHELKEGIEPIVYTVDNTHIYDESNTRTSDVVAVTNQFDDVNRLFTDTAEEGKILNMSRNDLATTFPTAPTEEDMKADEQIIEGFQPYVAAEHVDLDEEMPTADTENGLQLINLRGVPFDDPAWDLLLDQVKTEDIVSVIMDGAYNTKPIESIGKPATVDLDGPAGISAFMGDIHGTAYTSEVVMASTFNTDLLYQMGQMIGNEAISLGVNGWYAPGLNLHRNQFAGRNFEYYSEDPLLSGKIAQAVVEGTSSKGLTTFIKHYALNDQETNRVNNGVSTWANEQAIREIYLKPFEMVVKNSKTTLEYHADDDGVLDEKEMNAATAIMSSFNRVGSTWAGGSHALMQTVLRDEWGFEGVAVSDFNLYDYMYVNQGIAAGTDYNITFASNKTIEDTESVTAVNDLRKSAHRILYAVANSNTMNGIIPGTTISYEMATWKKVQIIVDIVIILGLITGFVINRRKKQKRVIESNEAI